MRLLIPGFSLDSQNDRSAELAKYYRLPLVKLNVLLTNAIRTKTALGNGARACLECGRNVPDRLFFQLLEERLTDADMRGGWVLSGFPRTVNQAMTLASLLADIAQPYDRVIYMGRSLDLSVDLAYAPTPLVSFYCRRNALTVVDVSQSVAGIDRVLRRSRLELTDA